MFFYFIINIMQQIKINNLLWDTSFTMTEPLNYQDVIKACPKDKRLPTKTEWDMLIGQGFSWDDTLNGWWIGVDHTYKQASTKCLFVKVVIDLKDSPDHLCRLGGKRTQLWTSTIAKNTVYGTSNIPWAHWVWLQRIDAVSRIFTRMYSSPSDTYCCAGYVQDIVMPTKL